MTTEKDKDLEQLVNMLRQKNDPARRKIAAKELGERHNMEAVESLARSALEDPEPGVQQAARAALNELLGNQAAEVLATYRSADSEDDSWLIEEDIEQENEAAAEDASGLLWGEDDIKGLVLVARHEKNPAYRLRALRRLGKINSTSASDTLAILALNDDDEMVRSASKMVLEEIFGEGANTILDNYRSGGSGFEEDEEESGEIDEDSEDSEDVNRQESPFEKAKEISNAYPGSPVSKEEPSANLPGLILAAIFLIAVVVIVLLVQNFH